MLTSQNTVYSYDSSGRLSEVSQTGGTSTEGNTDWKYTYDADGNRLTATASGTETSSQNLSYNPADQITNSGYVYDANGNLTAAPAATGTGSATYTYNAANQMTAATVSGTTTHYTYVGASQNQVLSAATTGGSTLNYTCGGNGLATYQNGTDTSHVFNDPTTGQPTLLTTSSGVDALYIDDGLGNLAGITPDSGTTFNQNYDPFGVTAFTSGSSSSSAQNPYGFKNGTVDHATGLIKFGQRWYDSQTGTLTQRDTLDTPLDPSNADRYVFAGGDPINNSDPAGSLSAGPELTGCFYICLTLGALVDQDGHVSVSAGLGVGDPSVSGGIVGSTSNADTGYGAEASCSAGFAKAGIDTEGNTEGSIGTEFSTGQCDAEAVGTLRVA